MIVIPRSNNLTRCNTFWASWSCTTFINACRVSFIKLCFYLEPHGCFMFYHRWSVFIKIIAWERKYSFTTGLGGLLWIFFVIVIVVPRIALSLSKIMNIVNFVFCKHLHSFCTKVFSVFNCWCYYYAIKVRLIVVHVFLLFQIE